jgi:hypothetical protein
MKVCEVQELVGRVGSVDADCADWVVLQGVVGELARLKSWVEGREVFVAGLVAKVSSFPEKSLAEAGRTSLRHGEQVIKRAETIEQIPTLGTSLDAGRVSGGHVDVLARTLTQLQPDVRQRLIDAAASLVTIAENTTPEEFARTVGAQARRLERDSDGLERLERQRRAVRFDSWVDRHTGMGRWSATWDPETMLRLENLLDAKVQALFHDTQPANCPTDLLAKQSFLRAHAVSLCSTVAGPASVDQRSSSLSITPTPTATVARSSTGDCLSTCRTGSSPTSPNGLVRSPSSSVTG